MKKIFTIILMACSCAFAFAQDLDMSLYTDAQIKAAVYGVYAKVGEWENDPKDDKEEANKISFEALKAEHLRVRAIYGKSGEPAMSIILKPQEGLRGVHWFSIKEMLEEMGMTPEEADVILPDANGALVEETGAVEKKGFMWIVPEGLGTGDIYSDEDGDPVFSLAKGSLERFKQKVNLAKSHGYTVDPNETNVPGEINVYRAESDGGYEITIMFMQKKLNIVFNKVEAPDF